MTYVEWNDMGVVFGNVCYLFSRQNMITEKMCISRVVNLGAQPQAGPKNYDKMNGCKSVPVRCPCRMLRCEYFIEVSVGEFMINDEIAIEKFAFGV